MPRPLPFVLAASDHGPMIVSRLDYAQSPHGYFGVGFQILHTGGYENDELGEIQELLDDRHYRGGDGVVALDCGANIGVHTIDFAKHMTGWGNIIACEPQERLYYALCGNIALNNLFNARAIFAAAGSCDGILQIPVPDYSRPASLGSLELRRTEQTEFIGQPISYAACDLVPVVQISIDGLILPRCDLIKIDVEGMELSVLQGASATIERCRPTLVIEWIKCGLDVLRDFLVPRGYSCRVSGMNLIATCD